MGNTDDPHRIPRLGTPLSKKTVVLVLVAPLLVACGSVNASAPDDTELCTTDVAKWQDDADQFRAWEQSMIALGRDGYAAMHSVLVRQAQNLLDKAEPDGKLRPRFQSALSSLGCWSSKLPSRSSAISTVSAKLIRTTSSPPFSR